eukprot:1064555-Pyramimonas_sp.AAC.1
MPIHRESILAVRYARATDVDIDICIVGAKALQSMGVDGRRLASPNMDQMRCESSLEIAGRARQLLRP